MLWRDGEPENGRSHIHDDECLPATQLLDGTESRECGENEEFLEQDVAQCIGPISQSAKAELLRPAV